MSPAPRLCAICLHGGKFRVRARPPLPRAGNFQTEFG